jgi:protein O-mannosyl-transferase
MHNDESNPKTCRRSTDADGPLRAHSRILLSERKDLLYAVLFVLGCAPYLNTLRNGLVYDDNDVILNNPFISNAHHIWQIFTTPLWGFKTSKPLEAYFRPLVNLTFLGLHNIYGPEPAGYHIFNLLLMGCIVCALYAVTIRWTRNQPLALVTCVIFAFHPIHSETGAWIADLPDLEVSLFLLLAFWAYLGLERSRGFAWRRQLTVFAFFALALLSKEIAVALPMLALVFEHFYREDRKETSFVTKVSRYAGLWVLFGLFLVYRRVVLGPLASRPHHPEVNAYSTALTGFELFGKYVERLFWPYELHMYYGFKATTHILEFGALFGIVSFATLMIAGLVCLRRLPIVSFGIVWFFAFILLVLNVQWLAAMAPFGERYLFLPSVGFCWICALGALRLWRASARMGEVWRPVLATAACVVMILAFVRIYTRNRAWHDSATIIGDLLQGDANTDVVRNNMGVFYWNTGKHDLAVQNWEIAHRQGPSSYSPMLNLAMAAVLSGDWATAESYLAQLTQLWPREPDPHRWMGVMRERQGRYDEAEKEMLKVEELSPYNMTEYNDLGHLYAKEGKLEDAVQQMERSAELMDDPLSWDDLGDYYLKLGQVDNAEHAYRAALDSNKYDSESHVGLGEVYERRGDKTRAEKEYAIGLEKQPNNPIAIAGLARLRQSESN